MSNIDSLKLIKFLKNFILSTKTTVPFIHGRAGIGKTEIVSSIAKKLGYKLIILNLNHQEEGDLLGIPREEDGIMVYSKPEWIGRNENESKVIVFLDEIDRAQKNILNVSLTLIREYRIHTHILPKTWKLIRAGNSGINDDFYDTNEIDFALKSRFIHIFYEISHKGWIEWAIENKINSFIIEFLKMNPKFLVQEPQNNEVFSYPNPRTWNILSDALEFTPKECLNYVILGTIGEEVGTSFLSYLLQTKSEDFPIPFTEFLEDLNLAIKKYEKKSKQGVLNTNVVFLNNFQQLRSSTPVKVFLNVLSHIICSCIKKEYYELIAVIFRTIKGFGENGVKFNLQLISFIESNPELKKHYQKYKNIISSH